MTCFFFAKRTVCVVSFYRKGLYLMRRNDCLCRKKLYVQKRIVGLKSTVFFTERTVGVRKIVSAEKKCR